MSAPTKYSFQWQRDGVDIAGATTASYTLQSADVQELIKCAVTATNAAGSATALSAAAKMPVGAPVLTASAAPLVVPAVNGSGASLRTVGSSERLKLAGCAVWGITDFITCNESTGANNHADRVAACAAMASRGVNVIRLRALADEYTHLPYMGSTANYLQWVKDWRDAAKAEGIYLMICAWDSLDSQSGWNDANWATQYSQAFPMFTAIYNALKIDGEDDPFVFYEPFNEPNNVNWDQWQTAMQATTHLFRSNGFQGLLVLDTTTWSHDYSDQYMGALESYDATMTATGRHNLAFARHDYCDDYGNDTWSYDAWVSSTGNTETAHVIMETEFGYDNGGDISDSFCQEETSGFQTQMFDRSNIAGGTAFVFNWVDANSMGNPDGSGTTGWGSYVGNWLSGAGARQS